jgi:hypothetical protein
MPRSNHKLSFKYFGPYKILSRVGAIAYQLQLPSTSAIHHVVHVLELKPATCFKGMVVSKLPANESMYRIPMQVLETRMISRGSAQVAQVKVLSSGMTTDLATWEDLEALKQQFLHASTVATEEAWEQNQEFELRRGQWAKKKNVRVSGLEWG